MMVVFIIIMCLPLKSVIIDLKNFHKHDNSWTMSVLRQKTPPSDCLYHNNFYYLLMFQPIQILVVLKT